MRNMKNYEVSGILNKIALFLEMDNVQFKPRAYERAARSVEALEQELDDVYEKGGIEALKEIPGIGESIAEKIEELIKTGKLEYYEKLKEKVPVDLDSLYGIEGLGPKKIKVLWEQLNVKNIDDLEKACLAHKVSKLPGFQEKTEQNILKGIAFAKKSKGRYILGFALPYLREIEERLRSFPEVQKVAMGGSVRRMKETIGDADFLVASENPERVMTFFVSMPEVSNVFGKGETKASVRFKTGMQSDLRVVPMRSFGAAIQYFTGNKDHNVSLRRVAQEKGWKLSEYGLFSDNKIIAGTKEEEIYQKLGMKWIPPEMRENTGEIEVAIKNELPKIIEYKELKGDLQVHSNWTDGSNTIREMAEEARNFGLEYIVISDHSKSLAMTGGLDEKMFAKQGKEIDKLNQESSRLRILKGAELNVMKDGKLDISDQTLEKLDVVGAAIHSHFNLSKEEMTNRILTAIENPNVDIIYHPTARQLQKREAIELDLDKIFERAKETGTILDIDSYPDRLDLKDEYIRRALEFGCKLDISSDSHAKINFHYLELGIAQARRGWATANDIVNTRSLEDFSKMLKSPLTVLA
jgi:DNA polymerase (family X)